MLKGPVIILQRRVLPALAVAATMGAGLAAAQSRGKAPSITLRSTPTIAFAPARIVVTAELSGGPDDYQDYYCAKVEWDWDDATKSEATDDCDPYEAGKSVIRRRYANEHKFELPGQYNVRFTLKQGDKRVGSGTILVRVRDTERPR